MCGRSSQARAGGGVEGQSASIESDELGAGPGVLAHRRATYCQDTLDVSLSLHL
jgi:hypothetical protein